MVSVWEMVIKLDDSTLQMKESSKEENVDTVTTAILAAVSAGVTTGATKVGEQANFDSYTKLTELLGKKFGTKSKVVNAVKELDANPKSEARKAVVKEEVSAAKANRNRELLKIANSLLKRIETLPGGTQIIQTAIGDQNVQIAGNSNVINVSAPKSKR